MSTNAALQNVSDLPIHPYRRFLDLVDEYCANHVKTNWKKVCLRILVGFWYRIFSIFRFEESIQNDLIAKKDPFELQELRFRSIYFPEILGTLVLEKTKVTDPCVMAALLVRGTLEFRRDLVAGKIESDKEAGRSLDMRKYLNFFSRIMSAKIVNGHLVHQIRDFGDKEFVVVSINGHIYKLNVGASSALASVEELSSRIRSFSEDAKTRSTTDLSFGLLSIVSNRESAKIFAKLEKHVGEEIATIDSALFFVAIDLDSQPSSADEVLSSIHSVGFRNRDHRRSLQIVVSGNCRAGISVSPHSGPGGTLSARLVSELHSYCQKSEILAYERFEFEPLSRIQIEKFLPYTSRKFLADAKKEIQRHELKKTTVYSIPLGLKELREKKLSVDAVFHCALHRSYYETFGKPPEVGNFINLRGVAFGDIWRYRSTTDEMLRYILFPTAQNLVEASTKHRSLVRVEKTANSEVYLGTLVMITLFNRGKIGRFALSCLVMILSLFGENFLARFMVPDIWVSNIPAKPGLESVGRAAQRMGFLRSNGFAGHYVFHESHLTVCLLPAVGTREGHAALSKFIRRLEASLLEAASLFI